MHTYLIIELLPNFFLLDETLPPFLNETLCAYYIAWRAVSVLIRECPFFFLSVYSFRDHQLRCYTVKLLTVKLSGSSNELKGHSLLRTQYKNVYIENKLSCTKLYLFKPLKQVNLPIKHKTCWSQDVIYQTQEFHCTCMLVNQVSIVGSRIGSQSTEIQMALTVRQASEDLYKGRQCQ